MLLSFCTVLVIICSPLNIMCNKLFWNSIFFRKIFDCLFIPCLKHICFIYLYSNILRSQAKCSKVSTAWNILCTFPNKLVYYVQSHGVYFKVFKWKQFNNLIMPFHRGGEGEVPSHQGGRGKFAQRQAFNSQIFLLHEERKQYRPWAVPWRRLKLASLMRKK